MTAEIVDDDEPLTLRDACNIIFKGRITPSTLKAEADRGNLRLEKIGKRYFTTASAIKEMRRKCLVKGKAPALHSERSEVGTSSGSSGTEQTMSAQAALRQTLKELRES